MRKFLMNVRSVLFMVMSLLMLTIGIAIHAQANSDLLAYVNSSQQLVVVSGDGGFRWIVTNPGEFLADPVGYTWSPDGDRIFFAVQQGGSVSLRVGDVNTQSWNEIANVPAGIVGGEWSADGRGVLIGSGGTIRLYDADNGDVLREISGLEPPVVLVSPFSEAPNFLPYGRSLSPDGESIIFQAGLNGRYFVGRFDGSVPTLAAPLNNDPAPRYSALWSDDGSAVAYWGYDSDGTSVIAVTDVDSQTTVTLDSGRAIPVTLLGWSGDVLVYRDSANRVLAARAPDQPLESGVQLLPPDALDIMVVNGGALFRTDSAIQSVGASCVDTGDCLDRLNVLVNDAAAMPFEVRFGTIVYTAQNGAVVTSDGLNVFAFAGASAGVLSPGGAYVALDLNGGLSIANTLDGSVTEIAPAPIILDGVRWN